eukprot:2581418-Prymnesium_polylepis.1
MPTTMPPELGIQCIPWPALERGDAAAIQTFCERLHEDGWAVIRLPDVAASELEELRQAAFTFFELPSEDKTRVGSELCATYVGYRDSPQQGAEFLETYLTPEGGCYPDDVVKPPGLAEAAASLH